MLLWSCTTCPRWLPASKPLWLSVCRELIFTAHCARWDHSNCKSRREIVYGNSRSFELNVTSACWHAQKMRVWTDSCMHCLTSWHWIYSPASRGIMGRQELWDVSVRLVFSSELRWQQETEGHHQLTAAISLFVHSVTDHKDTMVPRQQCPLLKWHKVKGVHTLPGRNSSSVRMSQPSEAPQRSATTWHPTTTCHISVDNRKIWPDCDTMWQVSISLMQLQYIFWGPWIFVPKFVAICQSTTLVQTLFVDTRVWTKVVDWPTFPSEWNSLIPF